jgi:hypothetical protein
MNNKHRIEVCSKLEKFCENMAIVFATSIIVAPLVENNFSIDANGIIVIIFGIAATALLLFVSIICAISINKYK